MSIRFDERVAIVTGAGNGLGREYALALAARGARVVVNDFGGAVDGSGGSETAAQQVCREIVEAGGQAIANAADVTDLAQVHAMVDQAIGEWGRIDILINNAGILRDRSFLKMTMEDFGFVAQVHLMGSVHCTKAAWPHMRAANYGRIVMTSSTAGLYGNFGQANYSAAKMALIGLMNTLRHEGEKNGIRVNTITPMAATRLTVGLQPAEDIPLLHPSNVVPGTLFLVSEDAPNGAIMVSGAGGYSRVRLVETRGANLGTDATPEDVAEAWDGPISDRSGEGVHTSIHEQGAAFQQLVRG